MKWLKRGLIFAPDKSHPWISTRTTVPTPYLINDTTIRIYAGFCDRNGISRIGFIDVMADNPSKILDISKIPALDIGRKGCFDENGVIPTCIIHYNSDILLYYLGFQSDTTVRYLLFAGLAISSDGGKSFKRYSEHTILPRINDEQYVRSAPFVVQYQSVWTIFYASGNEWINVNSKLIPKCSLRSISSETPLKWLGKGREAVRLKDDEYGLGRPFIYKLDRKFLMFYSVRSLSKSYRIGYATSDNLEQWDRKDSNIDIDVSPEGWDSESICYASLVEYKNRVYMFYNGNNFGETGIGYTILEEW